MPDSYADSAVPPPAAGPAPGVAPGPGQGGVAGPPGGSPQSGAAAPTAKQIKINPFAVRRALGGALRWAGRRWAESAGVPSLELSEEEVTEGVEVWYDVVEAFLPGLVLGPRLSAVLCAGIWVYGVRDVRRVAMAKARAKRTPEAPEGKAEPAHEARKQAADEGEPAGDEDAAGAVACIEDSEGEGDPE